MRGYRRYPWGGVETGGLLFGARGENGVRILAHRGIDCEHEFGPVFELSERDLAGVERLLAKAVPEEKQSGLELVGWYHSVSNRDLGLTREARKFHERFFPEDWQVCMVLRRSKHDPLAVGFFLPDPSGMLEALPQSREFAIENFRIRASDLPFSAPAGRSERVESPKDNPDGGLAPIASLPPAVHAAPPAIHAAPLPMHPTPPAMQAIPPVLHATPLPIRASPLPIHTGPLGLHMMAPAIHSASPAVPAFPSEDAPSEEAALSRAKAVQQPPPEGFRPCSVPVPARHAFEYFGLGRDPFSQTPDPRLFYASPGASEALANLQHGVQRRSGFSVLIGESGVGKSLVLECLIEQLKAEQVHFAYLFNSRVNPEQFFELLANDLDLECASPRKSSILIALNERLVAQCQAGQTTALIIDNAQKLQPEVLEEIELLGNLENRHGKLLQVVLAGQPSFERRLDLPELRGLRQRLLARARLSELSEEQTAGYIASRLDAAGWLGGEIFPGEVLKRIYLRTGGVPRLINAVCGGLLQRCMDALGGIADVDMLEGVCHALELGRFGARREDQDPDIEAVSA